MIAYARQDLLTKDGLLVAKRYYYFDNKRTQYFNRALYIVLTLLYEQFSSLFIL